LRGFLGSRDHLVPDPGLRPLIAEQTTYDRLEKMPIELHVVAVDVLTGEGLRLARGPALEAAPSRARRARSRHRRRPDANAMNLTVLP
jgi:hypothetical protein